MRREQKNCALLAVLLFLIAPVAKPVPVIYSITFDATGSVTDCGGDYPCDYFSVTGKEYYGLFAVDDSVLQSDGLGKSASVLFFTITMEDNIWAYNLPSNNSFVGFRGPCELRPDLMACINASSPGFDVIGGEIVNLRGGVYGVFDYPFVDLSLPWDSFSTSNVFYAAGRPVEFYSPGRWFEGRGTFSLKRVPEPGSLALLGLGLAGLGFTRRRNAN